ncbi:MAG: ABC transporter permease [bacterium]|nr:ABC transporter permease [bacterium]
MAIAIATHNNAIPRASFGWQFWLLTGRFLKTVLRNPGAALPSLLISIFTLLIYQESFGTAATFIPGLAGNNYTAFVLPLSLLSVALTSAVTAGAVIVSDISTGYFDKLLLTPVSRTALLLSVMFVGSVLIAAELALIMLLGVLLGVNPPTGLLGALAVIGIAVLVGNALAGLGVGIALLTGSPAATQSTSLLFFPLTQLTAAFTPLELLGDTLRAIAQVNPATYVLKAMRTILLEGWGDTTSIMTGVLVALVLCAVTFMFALVSLRIRTGRK